MKIFGKDISDKVKRDLLTRLVLIIMSGTVLIVSATFVTSVAWFSNNSSVSGTGMQVVVATDSYELIVERRAEYDRISELDGTAVYPGVSSLKTTLGSAGYDFIETSASAAPLIAFELFNEYPFIENGVQTYYLRPGAYGTLTFYLRPLDAADLTIDFSFEIGGFENTIDASSNLVIEEVTSSSVLDFLKGHLLFFTGRTGLSYYDYVYTGLIDSGTFSYSTEGKSKSTKVGYTDCYEITLYWEWPLTYSEIIDNVSTSENVQDKKYPANVGTFFNNNKSYFLTKNLSSSDETELNDGYNDADQIIGDNVDYIVVYIKDSE